MSKVKLELPLEDLERHAKSLADMNVEGMRSLGHEMQLDGSLRNVPLQDILAMAQNGARISVRWSKLAGVGRVQFMQLIAQTWERQTAEDTADGVCAEKAVLS
jgi:hypothetical protein